jgi:hypothetical protein
VEPGKIIAALANLGKFVSAVDTCDMVLRDLGTYERDAFEKALIDPIWARSYRNWVTLEAVCLEKCTTLTSIITFCREAMQLDQFACVEEDRMWRHYERWADQRGEARLSVSQKAMFFTCVQVLGYKAVRQYMSVDGAYYAACLLPLDDAGPSKRRKLSEEEYTY